MREPWVQKVDLPTETLVVQAFPRLDYADAYRARLPNGAPNDLDAIARAALGTAAAPRPARRHNWPENSQPLRAARPRPRSASSWRQTWDLQGIRSPRR